MIKTNQQFIVQEARGHSLFYTDGVNYLRQIFNTNDYDYIDNYKEFKGNLIICNKEKLMMVQFKSEISGFSFDAQANTFKDIRIKINQTLCKEQEKGILSYLAQVWDYMSELPSSEKKQFTILEDLLVLPIKKRCLLDDALKTINITLEYTLLENQQEDISILIFKHNELDAFFKQL